MPSAIPKTGSDDTWSYPSPQMFYNALKRKGKGDDVAEDEVTTLVGPSSSPHPLLLLLLLRLLLLLLLLPLLGVLLGNVYCVRRKLRRLVVAGSVRSDSQQHE